MLPLNLPNKKVATVAIRVTLLLILVWYLVCSLLPAGNGAVVHDISFPPGRGIKKLATDLKRAGLIRSSWHFVLAARLRGQAGRLKAGDYRINDGMTFEAILRKLAKGEVDYRRFALPEGYSIYQAAELLDQKGIFTKESFLKKCCDSGLLSRLGISAGSAEGYLYPATYNLSLDSDEAQLIGQMVRQSGKVYSEVASEAGRRGLNRHELLTLASMIEKEAVSADERPLISSVFHNRLRIGMPLQSDPTAVYGVRAFGGKVTKADIMRPSPYNTYLNRGLPPGPIGNPGADAIRAALYPAQSDYLYFVARQNGTHQFSRSLDEHNRAVVRYLKR